MQPVTEDVTAKAIDLVRLAPLMELSSGIAEVVVGLIDGPVAMDHPNLAETACRAIADGAGASCSEQEPSFACQHGTYVAGILAANRGSVAPAICPGCTFLIRSIFAVGASTRNSLPSATPDNLAKAITDCIGAGARILNISAAIVRPSARAEHTLEDALNLAAQRGVLVVSAAGNQSTMGGTAITSSPWVIPVAACDRQGRPLHNSNLGSSIGRRGLLAPGDSITSLSADGGQMTSSGTSAAAPFVAGAIALLWSSFPDAKPARIKRALIQYASGTRTSVVPPLLDAWASYQASAGGSASRAVP